MANPGNQTMQKRSPCIGCDLKTADKNNDWCVNCNKRIVYAYSMGGCSESLSVRMTDMATKYSGLWTDEELQYLRDNYLNRSNGELADHLGRTVRAVVFRLSKLGLRRRSRSKPKQVKTERSMLAPGRDTDLGPVADRNAKLITNENGLLLIDFSNYPGLFDSIKDLSKQNFCTPENHVLYLISEATKKMNPFKKRQYEKVPIKIVDIVETTDRIIQVELENGYKPRIRRDLIDIYGSTAFLPRWLHDKIKRRIY